MRCFESATNLVSLAGLFSRNESIDEIPTEHLQYLLLPALLGSLALKITSGERKEIVDVAEIYFKDFLQRCNDYGLSDYVFKEQAKPEESSSEKSEIDQLAGMVKTRANKIQRFKEEKELKARLDTLKENMDNEHVDEEIKRNYFMTMIKLTIYEAIDELYSIELEKPILEHIATLSKDEKPKRLPAPPLKPFIITKDEVQKAVFGAGYPSLPTMTVQEFYDKRVKDGIFPDPTKKKSGPMSLQEASLAGISLDNKDEEDEAKEKLEEADDPDNLQRLRDKDEFKDDHRRGWGNRMNRS